MGYRIIADAVGLRATSAADNPDVVEIDDPHWHGYLANISPSEFRKRFQRCFPNRCVERILSLRMVVRLITLPASIGTESTAFGQLHNIQSRKTAR